MLEHGLNRSNALAGLRCWSQALSYNTKPTGGRTKVSLAGYDRHDHGLLVPTPYSAHYIHGLKSLTHLWQAKTSF
jgi:hypothetical protein